jgi:hypothetical protein
MTLMSINRDRVRINNGHDAASDDHWHCKAHAIGRQRFEAWADRGRLAIAGRRGATCANRKSDYARFGQREIDRFRLRVARSEA